MEIIYQCCKSFFSKATQNRPNNPFTFLGILDSLWFTLFCSLKCDCCSAEIRLTALFRLFKTIVHTVYRYAKCTWSFTGSLSRMILGLFYVCIQIQIQPIVAKRKDKIWPQNSDNQAKLCYYSFKVSRRPTLRIRSLASFIASLSLLISLELTKRWPTNSSDISLWKGQRVKTSKGKLHVQFTD